MEKIILIGIAILIFLVVTFLYWKLTRGYAQKEYGSKMFKHWGTRMYYWHGAIMISGGLTLMIIFLLKSANVLGF
jgi:magnesium-transporting ATPase (P-type)